MFYCICKLYKFPGVFNCASFIARSRSDLSEFPWIIPREPLLEKIDLRFYDVDYE